MEQSTKNTAKTSSVFDKLEALAQEIGNDIRTTGDDNTASTLPKLREKAFLDRSPEAEHVLLLYRAFRTSVAQSKEKARQDSTVSATEALPAWLRNQKLPQVIPENALEGTSEQLVGVSATKKNIFRLRAINCLLSIISFSVMSSAPFIHIIAPSPSLMFSSNCSIKLEGTFSFSSYQACIASGVLIFVHSFLFCCYYLLPIDGLGNKHVPGLDRVLESCSVDQGTVLGVTSRVSMFCAIHSKLIEAIVDATLLLFNCLVTVIASIVLERGSEFTYTTANSSLVVKSWFTLSTFWLTFDNTQPACLPPVSPADKIRSSLAFLYFILFFQVLTLIVSLRSFAKEARGRAGISSSGGAYDKRSLVANSDPDGEDGVVEVSL